MNILRRLFFTTALAILPGASLHAASLMLTFDSDPVYVGVGSSVIFSGTVTNLESVVVDLNGCSVTLSGQFTTDNCSIFFDPVAGAPFTLNANGTAGDTAHFSMFTVTVDNPFTAALHVPYTGTFDITGTLEDGTGGSDTNLVQSNFDVVVTPEPTPTTLICLALPALALLRRRRR